MHSRELQAGDTVFDIGQDNAPAVVIDAAMPTVGELEDPLREIVVWNHTNKVVGFDDDTPTVQVVYADISSEPRQTYTLPATRVRRPRVEEADDVRGTAADIARSEFLREMFAALFREFDDAVEHGFAADIEAVAYETGLPDELVEYARKAGEYDGGV